MRVSRPPPRSKLEFRRHVLVPRRHGARPARFPACPGRCPCVYLISGCKLRGRLSCRSVVTTQFAKR